jgi:predicted ATPase with chaperone activity
MKGIKIMEDNDLTIDRDIWSQESVKAEILAQVKSVAEMLVEKNKKYGNSAIQPKRIFSKASPVEQINVRIDDKLSRIANQQVNEDEDAEFDLIGYLILKRVFNNLTKKTQEKTTTERTVITG